jgi:Cu(I)/Ag(I) efflux system periplasmic protein CusF
MNSKPLNADPRHRLRWLYTSVVVVPFLGGGFAQSAPAAESVPSVQAEAARQSQLVVRVPAPIQLAQAAKADAAGLADGEVRKIDSENKRLTVRHGEIKSLDMPAMTMVFQVKDAALLERAKVGEKIRFKAAKEGGAFVITELQVAN